MCSPECRATEYECMEQVLELHGPASSVRLSDPEDTHRKRRCKLGGKAAFRTFGQWYLDTETVLRGAVFIPPTPFSGTL